jgi:hypothetical protein
VASKRRLSEAAAHWRHEKAGSNTRRLEESHPYILMHLIERAPRAYSHRGYRVEALACGPYRYNVWRSSEDFAFCSVDSLRDAEAVIAEDLAGEVA